jgi:hypothetical protein
MPCVNRTLRIERAFHPAVSVRPWAIAGRLRLRHQALKRWVRCSVSLRTRPAMDGLSVGSQTDTLSADGTFKEGAGVLDGFGRRGASEHGVSGSCCGEARRYRGRSQISLLQKREANRGHQQVGAMLPVRVDGDTRFFCVEMAAFRRGLRPGVRCGGCRQVALSSC